MAGKKGVNPFAQMEKGKKDKMSDMKNMKSMPKAKGKDPKSKKGC